MPMDPTKGVLVKTCGTVADADLAASQLKAQGIDCVITTDDCGGMYPSLGNIQLLVEAERAEDARRILKETSTAPLPEIPLPETFRDGRQTSPPRVFRFNAGLVVGIVLGILIHLAYSRLWQLRDIHPRYDYDQDGRYDAEEIWKGGELHEWRFDRDGDGRFDAWFHYKNGEPIRDELDDNFDGRIDASFRYSARRFYTSGVFDTDHNGLPDQTTTFTNGVVQQVDWKPNGTNVVVLRHLFRHGVLHEELRDSNGDGLFDVSIQFDPFATPILTNRLRPTTQAP